jgi:DNA-binding transcriptional MerR regulator
MEIRISDLAKRSGCEVVTIRYYGLLPKPARSGGNFRLYGDIERLQFIRHCRSLDMRLAEIRTLLSLRQMPEAGLHRGQFVTRRSYSEH